MVLDYVPIIRRFLREKRDFQALCKYLDEEHARVGLDKPRGNDYNTLRSKLAVEVQAVLR